MEARAFDHHELTQSIIGAFYAVYNHFGFGLIESLYASALTSELRRRGHAVAREVRIPVHYRGEEIGHQRLDIVVDDAVVVEVKSTSELHANARRQLICYLHATQYRVGLLLHFGPAPKVYRLYGPGGPFRIASLK
jgi:GxxExxY protein